MHPFIEILGFKIPSYGLMMAIALITALLISYFRAKKAKLDLDIFSNMAIIAIICGLAGACLPRLAFLPVLGMALSLVLALAALPRRRV